MRWYSELKLILSEEPEIWLAYLHGQKINSLALLNERKPRYRGFVLQILKYGARLFRDLRFMQSPELRRPAKFFVFAGTANQMGALDQTIDSLRLRGETVVTICKRSLLQYNYYSGRYTPLAMSPVDAFRSLFLLITRGHILYKTLKKNHPVSVAWHFATFCDAYNYLAYFYRIMFQVKPDFVIVSNDHNVENRCLLAVAHHLKIKTVYLQHASVSPLFPALRVDYAFLDGKSALDTYQLCEPNQPDTDRNVPFPKVILSGQKKRLNKSKNRQRSIIGVALNALDSSDAAINFIKALARRGVPIRLRWHPGQIDRDIKRFRSEFSSIDNVSLSDPKGESISEFLGQIGWLIAGNSSIHLEAALADVMPIYYELTPPERPDYYGYVEHQLAKPAKSVEEVLQVIEETRKNHAPDPEAVRYYSATYLTEWEGREGELVAEYLQKLDMELGVAVGLKHYEITAGIHTLKEATYTSSKPFVKQG